jgi:hypothetical protein
MATVDQMERERKRTVGKPPATTSPKKTTGSVQPDFSAAVQSVATPARVAADLSWMKDPAFAGFVQEGTAQGLAGNNLATWVKNRALAGADFSGFNQPKPPTGGGGGTMSTQNANAPLMSALTQYANNMGSNTGMNSINDLYGKLLASTQSSGQSQQDSISNLYNQLLTDTRGSGQSQQDAIKNLYSQLLTDTGTRGQSQQDAINKFYGGAESQLGGLNADALAMLQNQYNQISGEIGTQTDAGRATIDESTQRALAALGGQANPYANLQMASAPAVTDPMSAYTQAVGGSQGGIDALQQMLQSQNAATGGGFSNLAQLLGASNQAAQQSRIGDVNVARAGAQQDLAANQRAAALRALQQSQQAQQAQQGTYAQQLLGLGQNRLQANLGAEQNMNDLLNQLQQSQLQANLGSQQNTSNLLSQLAQSQLQANLGSQQNTGNLLSQLQQSQLQSQLGQQQNTQGRQDTLMQQLLGLAGQGIDVSQIMALLGGQ